MTIDQRFICSSDVDTYYVDKTTGAPLAGGLIYFYSDINRTQLKPVYQISGSPPNYSFVALPNPCYLSAVGTFQDAEGNNIVPYYFPYDGTPTNSMGTPELYFIQVFANDGNNQPGQAELTREAWPPNAYQNQTPTTNEGYRNYIPNGQFLSHTDNPPVFFDSVTNTDTYSYAQGGFSLRRTHGGASVFDCSFSRITTAIAGINDFPRYAFNFVCTSFSATDQIRDAGWRWQGVNQFSSGDPEGSLPYTFFLAAQSNDSNTYTFDVRLVRNYGTGGTPATEEDNSIGTFVVTPGYNYFTLNISSIPVATGTLGDNNDDFIGIYLRGPSSTWNIQTTDFAMLDGTEVPEFFPVQTEADMKSRGVAGWMPMPNPDGSDLYLPLILTSEGMIFDQSQIGTINANVSAGDFVNSISQSTNELLCDGNSYVYSAYSALGIPFSRLGDLLWNNTINAYVTGAGIDYVTCYPVTSPNDLIRISTNAPGAQTNSSDGLVPTSFSFATLFEGSEYDFQSYIANEGYTLKNICTLIGNSGATFSDGTSDLTVFVQVNTPLTQLTFDVTASNTWIPIAGSYFQFGNISTQYYAWFTVDGSGSDPAPGGTGIKIPLLSTYSVRDCLMVICAALNGYQATNITTTAASTLTNGCYFIFYANASEYAVWYNIASAGTAPTVTATLIEVDLTGLETAEEVSIATQIAINKYKFSTPNLIGVTLKGGEASVIAAVGNTPYMPYVSNRFSLMQNYLNDLNTYQPGEIIQHLHSDYLSAVNPSFTSSQAGGNDYYSQNNPSSTGYYGAQETSVYNYYITYSIKY